MLLDQGLGLICGLILVVVSGGRSVRSCRRVETPALLCRRALGQGRWPECGYASLPQAIPALIGACVVGRKSRSVAVLEPRNASAAVVVEGASPMFTILLNFAGCQLIFQHIRPTAQIQTKIRVG